MNPTREPVLGTPASTSEESINVEIDGLPGRVKTPHQQVIG